MANAFINLLPTEPVKRRNVAETFLRAREASNQNALSREQIQNTQDTNALNKIKVKDAQQIQLYKEMAPDVAAWDRKWESTLQANGGERDKALAAIQPEWEKYVPAARKKGYPVTDTFDPDSTKGFLNVLKANKILADDSEDLTSLPYTDKDGTPLGLSKKTGTVKKLKVETGVTPTPKQKPTKTTLSEGNQAALFEEIQKQFPGTTKGEFRLASENSRATGRPLEYELKTIREKKSPAPASEEKPAKEPWWSGRIGGKKEASPASKTLDKATAQALFKEAGSDKNKARQLAKERGYRL